MTALNQTLIDTMLADSRFTSSFPDLAEARRRLVQVSQAGKSGGCCGDASPITKANDIRDVLSWLKRSVANWPQSEQTRLLGLLGKQVLQISYNNPTTKALTTVVIHA